MAQLGRAATADDILIEVHGRRLGIVGDAQSGDPSALLLDGAVVASRRVRGGLIIKAITAVAAGPITLTGAAVGDIVVSATDISTAADGSARFETVITVANQIQQIAASTDVHLVVVVPQS